MGLRYFRSISPGTRHAVLDSFSDITCNKPEKKLLRSNHRAQGRNHRGVITCRHRGGGCKRLYRKIDIRRKKLDSVGHIRTIEYDPNRNALLALVHYEDSEKTYILAPKGFQVGQVIMTGFRIPVEIGNTLPLWNIPLGINVYNVEFRPGTGRQLARSAGTSVQLVAREDGFVTLRLPSGEVRLVPQTCWATIGQVHGLDVRNKKMGKAGRVRWLGWRPTVRGKVINPIDHPHGGGEGCCPIGRSHPSTPWGKPSLGVKTRCKKKYSNILIVRRKRLLFHYLFFMVRSVKKGPYVAYHLLAKVERINELNKKSVVNTWSRSSIIVPIIIGHTISVYNGRDHISVFITDQIVGHKLGEFSPTRTFRGHTKLDKKTGRLI
jgi:large subunit ribosomal protein L2